jgi:GNAT superfamily N-acetyltransferase
MHRPPLLLTRATSSQLATIANIHRTAFTPTLWYKSLWGNCSAEAFDAWFVNKAGEWLDEEGEHFVVAMRGEDVMGYALWEEKEGPEEGEVEAEKNWPEGTNVEVADAFNRDMHKYTSTITGRYWREFYPHSHSLGGSLSLARRCADLHFLATSPHFQRSGAGKALIQWGIDRATKEGLSVYLEGGSGSFLSLSSLPRLTPSFLRRGSSPLPKDGLHRQWRPRGGHRRLLCRHASSPPPARRLSRRTEGCSRPRDAASECFRGVAAQSGYVPKG